MKCQGICADVGEGFAHDMELLNWIQAANICVGAHAGSEALTRTMIEECRSRSILVGLHPGYPDRENFGRKSISPRTDLGSEMAALLQPWDGADYVKPHGALYNQSAAEVWATEALAEALQVWKIPLLGLAGTLHEEAASHAGVEFWPEAYLDRGMREDGTLVPRELPGAFLHMQPEIEAQFVRFADRCRFFCVHGDGPDAIEIARIGHTLLRGRS